jgi:hypothetical protein
MELTSDSQKHTVTKNQCSGSVTFWYGLDIHTDLLLSNEFVFSSQ